MTNACAPRAAAWQARGTPPQYDTAYPENKFMNRSHKTGVQRPLARSHDAEQVAATRLFSAEAQLGSADLLKRNLRSSDGLHKDGVHRIHNPASYLCYNSASVRAAVTASGDSVNVSSGGQI